MANKRPNAVLENVELMFRNFAGRGDNYNREGDRNFAVRLDQGIAEAMAADGWNIKLLKPREDDGPNDPRQAYLQVSVSYKVRAPQIYLVTSRNRTLLTEDMVSLLDEVEIINADLSINPYEWEVNGNFGVKAYLSKAYITIQEDALDAKYDDLPLKGGH